MQQALPGELAEPLHLFPYDPSFWLRVVLAALVAAAALFLLGWWRRRRAASAPPVPARQASPAASAPVEGFAERVEAIRQRYSKLRAFRDGCHALSREVKTRLERATGAEIEEMTVAEIGRRLGEGEAVTFLHELRSRQFGRRAPEKEDFHQLCDAAKEHFDQPWRGPRSSRRAGKEE